MFDTLLSRCARACVVFFGLSLTASAAALDVTPFAVHDNFIDVQISPDGKHYAATVALEDRIVLVVLRASDGKVSTSINLGQNSSVPGFWWANAERLIGSVAIRLGANDTPAPTGELMVVNAAGGKAELLAGQRSMGSQVDSRIRKHGDEMVAAWMIDPLADDDDRVLVSIEPFTTDPYRRAERMDIRSGRRTIVARAPVRNAVFHSDHAGRVRFAAGAETHDAPQLFHRADDDAEWTAVPHPDGAGLGQYPVGFSADNRTAYLIAERSAGPDVVVAFDTASGERRMALEDDNSDPAQILFDPATRAPIGALFIDGRHRTAFFDDASPGARLYRELEGAFPEHTVRITSTTADGRVALLQAWSERDPGRFYRFDLDAERVDFLFSRRESIRPAAMGAVRPFELAARDGLMLRGYLTLPPGVGEAKSLPMVVMPHGGPFGIFDGGSFDPEAQLFAAAGYVVLQVNFRGSGNAGRAFVNAGARQWGRAIQDDITDATRWAIAQGIADPGRICIHGGSFGAYAALMGAAREPELYRCASGTAGVYDLALMHERGDIRRSYSGRFYLEDAVGSGDALNEVSPVHLADRIRASVFLAAGGRDERAPIEHSERMHKALKAAGVPVETLFYPGEGHGFYEVKHRVEHYQRLLAFLGRHLGPAAAD